jgi:hypothetical protein
MVLVFSEKINSVLGSALGFASVEDTIAPTKGVSAKVLRRDLLLVIGLLLISVQIVRLPFKHNLNK